MWLVPLQLFKNSTDTQGKLRLNLRSLSVSELLEYGRISVKIVRNKEYLSYNLKNMEYFCFHPQIFDGIWQNMMIVIHIQISMSNFYTKILTCSPLYSDRAWLEDHESEVVHRISTRISSLTGLDASFQAAEEMQVIWIFLNLKYLLTLFTSWLCF